jgi:hypothetical protein
MIHTTTAKRGTSLVTLTRTGVASRLGLIFGRKVHSRRISSSSFVSKLA